MTFGHSHILCCHCLRRRLAASLLAFDMPPSAFCFLPSASRRFNLAASHRVPIARRMQWLGHDIYKVTYSSEYFQELHEVCFCRRPARPGLPGRPAVGC